MNVIKAVKQYVERMVDLCGAGLKVLLMDKETTSIITMVVSQSEMLSREVYLFERIDAMRNENGDSLKFLKCIVFVRPTRENVDLLKRELQCPRFGQYFIYFSNAISKADVKSLAEFDEHECVSDLQEFYCDYIAVNSHLFSMNIVSCYNGKLWNSEHLERTAQGIISVLLSLRKCPTIRYQESSPACLKLAEQIKYIMDRENSLFHFKTSTESTNPLTYLNIDSLKIPPVLLLLDRKSDAVTPLLNQWTYQAMLHEIFTINNNRVNLSEVPGITRDLKEVILSAEQDEFYERNMYLNYGEIGANIKELMEEFQQKAKNHKQKVETIADMKAFIENYPNFKKMSGTVSKHVTLIGELSRLVTAYNLFEVSETEQEISYKSDHSECLKKVRQLINNNDRVRNCDALRLVLLYSLIYAKHSNNEIRNLTEALKRRGVSETEVRSVQNLLHFAGLRDGQSQNSSDLLMAQNVKAFTKKVIKGLKGVENIYTQHTPPLKEILEDLTKNRLKANEFPYKGTVQLYDKPQEIIVFMIGGTTYEESLTVCQMNKSLPGVRIILGGTCVHNFSTFLEEINSGTMTGYICSSKTKNF